MGTSLLIFLSYARPQKYILSKCNYARSGFSTFFLLELKATDLLDFFNLVTKVNILILVRVIKEMTTMQSTGENHAQQIR